MVGNFLPLKFEPLSPHVCGLAYSVAHGINIHYSPKNSYNYYLLYERLSPARNSLFHAASIFIAANDF